MQIFMGKGISKMVKRRWVVSLLLSGWILSGCGSSESETKEQSVPSPQIKVVKGAVDTSVVKKKSKENSGQFYYSYNKEKNSTEETKVKTTIDAYLNIKSPYEKVRITMMIKRLSHTYVIKCSACHDDYANGIVGPSLLDKDADFIYGRIMDFKSGKRKNVLMKELVSQIDDAKLKEIAKEIANFNKEIRKMRRGK